MLNAIGPVGAGLVMGMTARPLIPGRQAIGGFGTIALGVVEALAGGAAAHAMRGKPREPSPANAWPGYLTAILGAVILL